MPALSRVYNKHDGFTKSCDSVFGKAASGLNDEKVRAGLGLHCKGLLNGVWRKLSQPHNEACADLVDHLRGALKKHRDSGAKYDGDLCDNYKELVAKHAATDSENAEQLCKESRQGFLLASARTKAAESLKANTSIPNECATFMRLGDEDLKSSEWFGDEAKALAKDCYGELGKRVLMDATTQCGLQGAEVYKHAVQYKLGAADPELASLLTRAHSSCPQFRR